ncbi:MAG: hypothetical protein ABJC04_02185 [Verrucomicrobiota bacterium]
MPYSTLPERTAGNNFYCMFGDSNTLIASLIWGSIGTGFFIYGKKQGAMIPLFGGLVLVGLSYFISSALYMTLASLGTLAGMFIWKRYTD